MAPLPSIVLNSCRGAVVSSAKANAMGNGSAPNSRAEVCMVEDPKAEVRIVKDLVVKTRARAFGAVEYIKRRPPWYRDAKASRKSPLVTGKSQTRFRTQS